jgi:hypothetical protein
MGSETRNRIQYKFSREGALIAQQNLKFLEKKRYLDKTGVVRGVKKVIVTPHNAVILAQFLKEPNLFVDHALILERYVVSEYAILIFLESSDLYIQNFTIEEFEFEFGLPAYVMEMVVGLSDGKLDYIAE